jgi:hypothetical protein
VSKLAPGRFRYLVAARFVHQLALIAGTADLEARPLSIETPATLVESNCGFRATAARLQELARALERLRSAISRICPAASESTQTH